MASDSESILGPLEGPEVTFRGAKNISIDVTMMFQSWMISWGLLQLQAPLYPLKPDVSQQPPGLSGSQAPSGPT